MTKISKQQIDWLIKDKYQSKTSPKIKSDVMRLAKDEPLDYVIGWRPFLNTKIDLRYKPLIPRTETEYWAEKFINHVNNRTCKHLNKKSMKILDIFAGSGCIGIAILKNCPWVEVHFAEINKRFLDQIKINLRLNHIYKNYKLIKSDVFNSIKNKYDYILANPPYIPITRKLPKSVNDYEPRLALRAQDKGLYYIKKFLNQAPTYLNTNGKVWLEFDSCQKQIIAKQCQNKFKCSFFRDQYKKWRYVILKVL